MNLPAIAMDVKPQLSDKRVARTGKLPGLDICHQDIASNSVEPWLK